MVAGVNVGGNKCGSLSISASNSEEVGAFHMLVLLLGVVLPLLHM